MASGNREVGSVGVRASYPFPGDARWIISPDERLSLLTAVTNIMTLNEEDYRCPGRQADLRARLADAWAAWVGLVETIRRRLTVHPYACLVRGLPLDRAAPTLVALSCGLGEIVEPYRRPWSRLVRCISPVVDRSGVAGTLNERLHTDGTDWPEPNDITCLLCVKDDSAGGGRSRLLPIDAIMDLLAALPVEVASAARAELPWAIAEELGGGVTLAPVLSDRGVRWLRFTVEAALRQSVGEGHAPPGRILHALRLFEVALETAPGVLEFALRPGDLLIVDNSHCLHSRTALPNPRGSDRMLLRTKIASYARSR